MLHIHRRRPAILVSLIISIFVVVCVGVLIRTKNSLECTTAIDVPDTAEDLFQQGNDRYERGTLLQALFVFPSHSRECYLQAVNSYSQSLNLAPNQRDVLNNRANAYIGLEQLNLAISDYRHILMMDPDNLNAHLGLAGAYERSGQLDLAVVSYKEAIRLMEASEYWTKLRPEILAQYRSELENLRSKIQS